MPPLGQMPWPDLRDSAVTQTCFPAPWQGCLCQSPTLVPCVRQGAGLSWAEGREGEVREGSRLYAPWEPAELALVADWLPWRCA